MLFAYHFHESNLKWLSMMFLRHKTKPYLWILTLLLLGLWGGDWAKALTTRIKDIVNFQGVRENQLVGYGLVIGLNGTGDTLRRSVFTKESLVSMLYHFQ